MKTYSFKEALTRHREITSRLVSVKDLQKRFRLRTPDSIRAMLIEMGPFMTRRDAFGFINDFAITAENVVDFSKIFTEELVEVVVSPYIKQYADVMSSLKIPIPLLPDISLPDIIMIGVMNRVQLELTALLLDKVFDPALEGEAGRCGGMAFAGYDFYLQDRPVAGFGTTPPTEGPLGDYIYERLLDSLDLNARTFLEWWMILHVLPKVDEIATATLLAGAGSVGGPVGTAIGAFIGSKVDIFNLGGPDKLLDKTKDEWVTIKSKLDGEAAWPIGLIFSNKPKLFDQHQVLGIGYEDAGLGTARLFVWDNNFDVAGQRDRELRLDFRGDTLEVEESPKPPKTRIIKGIFHEEYKRHIPPLSI